MFRKDRAGRARSIQSGTEGEFEGKVVKDHEAAEMRDHLMDFRATFSAGDRQGLLLIYLSYLFSTCVRDWHHS